MIKEFITISINDNDILVYHEGTKSYTEQKDFISNLKECIEDELGKEKANGFIPYNNFESHIEWDLNKTKKEDYEHNKHIR